MNLARTKLKEEKKANQSKIYVERLNSIANPIAVVIATNMVILNTQRGRSRQCMIMYAMP